MESLPPVVGGLLLKEKEKQDLLNKPCSALPKYPPRLGAKVWLPACRAAGRWWNPQEAGPSGGKLGRGGASLPLSLSASWPL